MFAWFPSAGIKELNNAVTSPLMYRVAKMKGAALLAILLITIDQSASSRIYTAVSKAPGSTPVAGFNRSLLLQLKKGLIPVQFTQYGPPPDLPIFSLSPKTLPLLQKPPAKLPPLLPPPRAVRQMYQCLKTILRPQMYQQLVVAPQLRRYLRTFHPPVVETIQLKRPFCPFC